MVCVHFHMYVILKNNVLVYLVGAGGTHMGAAGTLHVNIYEPMSDKGNNLSLTGQGHIDGQWYN